MKALQKYGGLAALGHATALVVGLVLSFTVMFPLLDAAPDQALKFLADHQALETLWKLVVDWGSAITLVIMLLAFYERLKAGSLAVVSAAVVFGFLWAGLTIGASDLMVHNFGVVANPQGNGPAQVAAWTALVRGLWVLLLSLAAVRTGDLPRAPGYLGIFLGSAGILTTIPALAETMFMIFGPGMMVWSAWMGIIMLRRSPVSAAYPATE